ncbi:MAG: hypothetical protein Tsb0034_18130 [Ekhidna sp.]
MYTSKNILVLLLFSTMISLCHGCNNSGFRQRADDLFLHYEGQPIFYNLKKPDEKHFLPYVLEEVSGLAYTPGHTLITVDDESGKIFEYHPGKREIIHSIEFYKSADFEGVELVGNKVYALKSDGDIIHFDYGSHKKTKGVKVETVLSSKNDTEGLGYDPISHDLIIACKEEGGLEKGEVEGRAFYRFHLNTHQLEETPTFIIGPDELEAFWESKKDFDYDPDRIKFKPSAIAFHPITNDFYILSSVGKMIVVASREGQIQATYPIAPSVLGQPEGIGFSPDGDLFVSSEGEGDRGYILKFKMRRQ